jgi:3-phosphoshikimate 1-carboxyvinyltransferase
MVAGLRSLGATIDDTDPDMWMIHPIDGEPRQALIDCGLAGTVMRFLPPIAATGTLPATFVGDDAASSRPMEPILTALRQLGVTVDGDCLPFQVTGPIQSREAVINSARSSQFISGLLLSAPRNPEGIRVSHQGSAVPSLPHIDMTVAALKARGVEVFHKKSTWEVQPSVIRPLEEVIEPDLTTAAVFLAATLVTGGKVSVPRWPKNTTQPGAHVLNILRQFGADVDVCDSNVTVSATGDPFPGITIDLSQTSELTPVIAGLCALAGSPSVISGVAHIRGHETDRLLALSTQITALGGDCQETEDGLIITPRPLVGGRFRSYADHRIAHVGALIGLRVPGVIVDDIECTSKTMPEFPTIWKAMVL